MPYVLQMSGEFSDAERGLVTRKWVVKDEYGSPMLFATKREALECESQMASGYNNVAYYNVLLHNQYSGNPAVPKWVSSDPDKRPYWAQ